MAQAHATRDDAAAARPRTGPPTKPSGLGALASGMGNQAFSKVVGAHLQRDFLGDALGGAQDLLDGGNQQSDQGSAFDQAFEDPAFQDAEHQQQNGFEEGDGQSAAQEPAPSGDAAQAELIGLQNRDGLDFGTFDRRPRVTHLQQRLNAFLGSAIATDGMWGDGTTAAFQAFQVSEGIAPSEVIDDTTAEALIGPAQTTTLDPGSSQDLFGGVTTETRPFGTYTVLPPGTTAVDFPQLLFNENVMTRAEFDEVQAMWDSLVDGSSTIQVAELDPTGLRIPGFRDRFLGVLGSIMSKPVGRQLFRDIRSLGRMLLIAPANPLNPAPGQRSGGPVTVRDRGRGLAPSSGGNGQASDSTILIPPDLTDDSFVAFDRDGNPISAPVFEILGHEMAHALHNAQGANRSGEDGSDPAFDNAEEESAVGVENQLRSEHGISGQRFGHRARRRRPTDVT